MFIARNSYVAILNEVAHLVHHIAGEILYSVQLFWQNNIFLLN